MGDRRSDEKDISSVGCFLRLLGLGLLIGGIVIVAAHVLIYGTLTAYWMWMSPK